MKKANTRGNANAEAVKKQVKKDFIAREKPYIKGSNKMREYMQQYMTEQAGEPIYKIHSKETALERKAKRAKRKAIKELKTIFAPAAAREDMRAAWEGKADVAQHIKFADVNQQIRERAQLIKAKEDVLRELTKQHKLQQRKKAHFDRIGDHSGKFKENEDMRAAWVGDYHIKDNSHYDKDYLFDDIDKVPYQNFKLEPHDQQNMRSIIGFKKHEELDKRIRALAAAREDSGVRYYKDMDSKGSDLWMSPHSTYRDVYPKEYQDALNYRNLEKYMNLLEQKVIMSNKIKKLQGKIEEQEKKIQDLRYFDVSPSMDFFN